MNRRQDHRTCPICQTNLETDDDAWVVTDLPKTDDINNEIMTDLTAITSDTRRAVEANFHKNRPSRFNSLNEFYQTLKNSRHNT